MPPFQRHLAPHPAPIFAAALLAASSLLIAPAAAQTGTVPLSATFQTSLDKSGGVTAADCVLQMTAGRARELAGLRP